LFYAIIKSQRRLENGKRKKTKRRLEGMGKIFAFLVGIIELSLGLAILCYVCFDKSITTLQQIGLIVTPEATVQFWQGYVLVTFLLFVSVATLMALLIYGNGDSDVLR